MMHQRHLDHHSQAQRPHYLVTQGRWNEPSPPTLRSGIALSSIGLALLAAGIVIACGTTSGYSVFPLSSPFLLYGGVLLLLASAEGIARRVQRIKNHCGRCCFYQPLEGQYTLGRCRADPHESVVHRLAGCPFFSYSERAMVRDRFARLAESIERAQRARQRKYRIIVEQEKDS